MLAPQLTELFEKDRCGQVGGSMSLRVDFVPSMDSCHCTWPLSQAFLVDEDGSLQLLLLPSLLHPHGLYPSETVTQSNAFIYMLPWSLCFVTTPEK